MKIVDVNILVYVASRQSVHHKRVLQWWTAAFNGSEPVGLCWLVLVGFVRIATSPKILPTPLTLEECIERVETWQAHSNTVLLQESQNHWAIVRDTMLDSNVKGNTTTDAYLAAFAISRGARLVSCDNDFSRFRHLRWENPLD